MVVVGKWARTKSQPHELVLQWICTPMNLYMLSTFNIINKVLGVISPKYVLSTKKLYTAFLTLSLLLSFPCYTYPPKMHTKNGKTNKLTSSKKYLLKTESFELKFSYALIYALNTMRHSFSIIQIFNRTVKNVVTSPLKLN